AEVTEVPTNSQLEAVKKLLDMKIDSPAVESIKEALESQLRAHASEFQASREAAATEADAGVGRLARGGCAEGR
ncbi:unnamed protein product, partial [Symbiodinium sp. KB8]